MQLLVAVRSEHHYMCTVVSVHGLKLYSPAAAIPLLLLLMPENTIVTLLQVLLFVESDLISSITQSDADTNKSVFYHTMM